MEEKESPISAEDLYKLLLQNENSPSCKIAIMISYLFYLLNVQLVNF